MPSIKSAFVDAFYRFFAWYLKHDSVAVLPNPMRTCRKVAGHRHRFICWAHYWWLFIQLMKYTLKSHFHPLFAACFLTTLWGTNNAISEPNIHSSVPPRKYLVHLCQQCTNSTSTRCSSSCSCARQLSSTFCVSASAAMRSSYSFTLLIELSNKVPVGQGMG